MRAKGKKTNKYKPYFSEEIRHAIQNANRATCGTEPQFAVLAHLKIECGFNTDEI